MSKCSFPVPRKYLIEARKAAGYDRREDASCYLPFATVTMGRHERGDAALYPSDILLYASGYHAPELPLQYCRQDCPIGRDMLPQGNNSSKASIALLSTQFSNRMRALAGAANRLAAIADDDIVDSVERPEFDELIADLREVVAVYNDLQLYGMKKPGGHGADVSGRAALQG